MTRAMGIVVACVVLSCASMAGHPGAAQETVNPDAKELEAFQQRLEQYVKLRKALRKDVPPLKETTNPAEIQTSQDALAEKIRAARPDARQGEIFTPETQKLFRRLMYPETKAPDAAATKKAIKEDAPAGLALKVNAKYPEHEPLPTIPPNILMRLPKLPEDLEYRIVRNHLILRDVHANLIVDFIPNAIQLGA